MDFSERADFVEVRCSRIFDPRIQLSDDAQELFVAGERVHKSERALAAYGEGENGAWEKDRIPNRQDRESFWNDMFFVSHGIP
jgi:hypothetical protein